MVSKEKIDLHIYSMLRRTAYCNVEAIDGSAELCKLAGEYTGIEVKNMFFEELSEVEKYDGIWACSSILHLPILPSITMGCLFCLRQGFEFLSFAD